MTPLDERIYNYRFDPYFPTVLPLAVVFAVRDHVKAFRKYNRASLWYNRRGLSRRFKPSNFDNPVTSFLLRSLFRTPGPRKLKVWERILLALGF